MRRLLGIEAHCNFAHVKHLQQHGESQITQASKGVVDILPNTFYLLHCIHITSFCCNLHINWFSVCLFTLCKKQRDARYFIRFAKL